MLLSKGIENSDGWLLSSLCEAECAVKESNDYIGELISKRQKFKER